MSFDSVEEIFKIMESFPIRLKDSEILFQISNMTKYKICSEMIREMRNQKRETVLKDIQSY